MADAVLIQPDLEFTQRILGLGAHDLTTCYQCGTCSVVCPAAPASQPFPRKEMIWVQWGLKDRLLADPDVWLCHQCAACSTYCPRGARPADVMAALRQYSIAEYAVPRFMGRAVHDPKYLPFLLVFPAILLLAVLAWLGHLASVPAGPIVFSKLVPTIYIEVVFILAAGAALAASALGGIRYWKAMDEAHLVRAHDTPSGAILPTLVDLLTHRRFRECQDERPGSRPSYKGHLHLTHLAIFYGFLGLAATTTAVGIGIYGFGYLTPWPLWHPIKILGNAGGLAVLAACAVFLHRRLKDGDRAGTTTYADVFFLALLATTTLTGFLAEALRLAGAPALAYWVYFVHLTCIFCLLVYSPYSKFAHVVYRFVAILWVTARRAEMRGDGTPSSEAAT